MMFQNIFPSNILQSNFLQNITAVPIADVLFAMLMAIIVGLFIFLVYKKTFQGVMYSNSFSVALIGLTLVTTLVILAVSSNVVLSLGMLGALSIVRFRAAIKEPVEIVYLFWGIAAGIIIGAGLIAIAVIGSVIIGAFLFFFSNRKLHDQSYMLVLSCQNSEAANAALEEVRVSVNRFAVKAKKVHKAGLELSVEVRTKNDDTTFVERLAQMEGVDNALLVSYHGEYMVFSDERYD